MPIQLNEEDGSKLLNVHVSGKLTSADYEHFVPEVERLVSQHGKLRVLFDMTDFHGWDAGAVGRHQVRHQTLRRHRTDRDGRGNEVAARHGDVLQAVHESNNSIFRSRPIDRGEGVAGQGVMDL